MAIKAPKLKSTHPTFSEIHINVIPVTRVNEDQPYRVIPLHWTEQEEDHFYCIDACFFIYVSLLLLALAARFRKLCSPPNNTFSPATIEPTELETKEETSPEMFQI